MPFDKKNKTWTHAYSTDGLRVGKGRLFDGERINEGLEKTRVDFRQKIRIGRTDLGKLAPPKPNPNTRWFFRTEKLANPGAYDSSYWLIDNSARPSEPKWQLFYLDALANRYYEIPIELIPKLEAALLNKTLVSDSFNKDEMILLISEAHDRLQIDLLVYALANEFYPDDTTGKRQTLIAEVKSSLESEVDSLSQEANIIKLALANISQHTFLTQVAGDFSENIQNKLGYQLPKKAPTISVEIDIEYNDGVPSLILGIKNTYTNGMFNKIPTSGVAGLDEESDTEKEIQRARRLFYEKIVPEYARDIIEERKRLQQEAESIADEKALAEVKLAASKTVMKDTLDEILRSRKEAQGLVRMDELVLAEIQAQQNLISARANEAEKINQIALDIQDGKILITPEQDDQGLALQYIDEIQRETANTHKIQSCLANLEKIRLHIKKILKEIENLDHQKQGYPDEFFRHAEQYVGSFTLSFAPENLRVKITELRETLRAFDPSDYNRLLEQVKSLLAVVREIPPLPSPDTDTYNQLQHLIDRIEAMPAIMASKIEESKALLQTLAETEIIQRKAYNRLEQESLQSQQEAFTLSGTHRLALSADGVATVTFLTRTLVCEAQLFETAPVFRKEYEEELLAKIRHNEAAIKDLTITQIEIIKNLPEYPALPQQLRDCIELELYSYLRDSSTFHIEAFNIFNFSFVSENEEERILTNLLTHIQLENNKQKRSRDGSSVFDDIEPIDTPPASFSKFVFANCSKLTNEKLARILELLPPENLKELHLINCPLITKVIIKSPNLALVHLENMPALEQLDIQSSDNFKTPTCDNLKIVDCPCLNNIKLVDDSFKKEKIACSFYDYVIEKKWKKADSRFNQLDGPAINHLNLVYAIGAWAKHHITDQEKVQLAIALLTRNQHDETLIGVQCTQAKNTILNALFDRVVVAELVDIEEDKMLLELPGKFEPNDLNMFLDLIGKSPIGLINLANAIQLSKDHILKVFEAILHSEMDIKLLLTETQKARLQEAYLEMIQSMKPVPTSSSDVSSPTDTPPSTPSSSEAPPSSPLTTTASLLSQHLTPLQPAADDAASFTSSTSSTASENGSLRTTGTKPPANEPPKEDHKPASPRRR